MARALQGDAGRRFSDLIESVDGKRLMQIELARPMTRQNYVLVLA